MNRVAKFFINYKTLEESIIDFMADNPMAWLLFRIYYRGILSVPSDPRQLGKAARYLVFRAIQINPDLGIVRSEFEKYCEETP